MVSKIWKDHLAISQIFKFLYRQSSAGISYTDIYVSRFI
jgi:hypothetical protein